MNIKSGESGFSRFSNDYGMIFVLVLLIIGFSIATIEPQYPQGAEAGRRVAETIVEQHGSDVRVLVAAGSRPGDLEFTETVAENLELAGATVLNRVNGTPGNAGQAIREIKGRGEQIDVIAATEASARWPAFDRFPNVVEIEPDHWWPIMLQTNSLLGLAKQTAVYAIIAIGMTMVIITAGIDLSVGSLVALASVTTALVIQKFGGGVDTSAMVMLLAFAAGIAVCAAAGLFTGFMVTAFRLPSFIVTLGVMMMARGLALRLVHGESISLPQSLSWLGSGRMLGVPNSVWLMFALYGIAHVVMSRTVFGRYIYAIGGNAEAARLSGVPVRRVQFAVYVICGALAGLGGIVETSTLTTGDPTLGKEYELQVIAAVVVGGASLMGGRGKIFGTLIGAFIIAVIQKGMNLTGIQSFDQKIVLGGVLLAAVLIDTLKRRGGTK
jgi:ribose transport system permease protein